MRHVIGAVAHLRIAREFQVDARVTITVIDSAVISSIQKLSAAWSRTGFHSRFDVAMSVLLSSILV